MYTLLWILQWIFTTIGIVFVVGILIVSFNNRGPRSYSSGFRGDWARYRDKCNGTYDPKTDKPMKKG